MPDAGSCSSFLGAAFGCVHGSGIHSLDDVLLWRRSLERCARVRRVVVHMVPSRRGSCSSVAVAYFHACLQVATAAFLFLQRAMLACSARWRAIHIHLRPTWHRTTSSVATRRAALTAPQADVGSLLPCTAVSFHVWLHPSTLLQLLRADCCGIWLLRHRHAPPSHRRCHASDCAEQNMSEIGRFSHTACGFSTFLWSWIGTTYTFAVLYLQVNKDFDCERTAGQPRRDAGGDAGGEIDIVRRQVWCRAAEWNDTSVLCSACPVLCSAYLCALFCIPCTCSMPAWWCV